MAALCATCCFAFGSLIQQGAGRQTHAPSLTAPSTGESGLMRASG